MAKTGDNKKQNDKGAVKNSFVPKQLFEETAEKIDMGVAAMKFQKKEKIGIAEFIDKAVDAFIEKEKLTINK